MAGIELQNDDYIVFESENALTYGSQIIITSREEDSNGVVIATAVTQSGDTQELRLNSGPLEENNLIVFQCSPTGDNMFTIGAIPIDKLEEISENIELKLINGSKL